MLEEWEWRRQELEEYAATLQHTASLGSGGGKELEEYRGGV